MPLNLHVERLSQLTVIPTLNLQPVTTYNFEVADNHTYFVGELGVWVHNSSEIPCGPITQVEAGRMLGVSQPVIFYFIRSGRLTLQADKKTLLAETVIAFAKENGFPMLHPNALSATGAAEFLYGAVSSGTVVNWIDNGILPGWSFRGSHSEKIWRILRSDLRKFRAKHKDALRARGKYGAVSAKKAARLIGVGEATVYRWLEFAGTGDDAGYRVASHGPVHDLPGAEGAIHWVIPRDTLYRFAKCFHLPRKPGELNNPLNNRLDYWELFGETDPTYILDPNIHSIPADWVYSTLINAP